MFNFRHKSETLLETIVAIVVISLGISSALAMVVVSSRGNESIRNRLIAINLAREGLEVFENQRNANLNHVNYLSENKCWRALNIADCSSTNLGQLWGEAGDYGASIDYIEILNLSDMTWQLVEASDLITDTNPPSGVFSLYKQSNNVDDVFYTQSQSQTGGTLTNFYRAVRVSEIQDNDTDLVASGLIFTEGEILKLTSIVYFKTRSGFSKVEISTLISD